MFRIKLVVLSLLAAFTLNVTASSAFGQPAWKSNGGVLAATIEVASIGGIGTSYLRGKTNATETVEIICTAPGIGRPNATNVLEVGGKNKIKWEYFGCKVEKWLGRMRLMALPTCKVHMGSYKIVASGKLSPVHDDPTIEYTIVEAESEVKIEKANAVVMCGVEGNFAIGGTQDCMIPPTQGPETLSLQFNCTPYRTGLKFNGKEGLMWLNGWIVGAGTAGGDTLGVAL